MGTIAHVPAGVANDAALGVTTVAGESLGPGGAAVEAQAARPRAATVSKDNAHARVGCTTPTRRTLIEAGRGGVAR
jgi:hypothetical protein